MQEPDQLFEFSAHEAQTVHSGIKLYMDREILHLSFFKYTAQCLEGTEVRYARFQTIVYHFLKRIGACRKHHYRSLYITLTQFYSLYRISHCKIICSGILHQ